MHFPSPLVKGTLIKRYKRFLADVQLADGEIVTAHCPNTGSMTSCGSPGDSVYLLHAPSPRRKLDYTWELTSVRDGFIGINTQRPNTLVAEALEEHRLAPFADYDTIQREVKVAEGTKIDFRVRCSAGALPDAYIEVKNVTLREGEQLMFPDAKTARGTKHLHHLKQLAEDGYRAVILYVINRPEALPFQLARHIDPGYYEAFEAAVASGVEPMAFRVDASLEGLRLAPDTIPGFPTTLSDPAQLSSSRS